MDKERDVVKNTMDRIRAYLEHNPDAADTVDGVQCWLTGEPVRDEIIRAALEKLVEIGEVQKEKLPGGKDLYRRWRTAQRLQ